jgi:hypothetical protein
LNDANAAETVYVRSTTATNTFKFNLTTLTAADTAYIAMASGATISAVNKADLISITPVGNPTGGTAAASAITAADGASATTKGIKLDETASGTVLTGVTFTTGALAAGTYTIWIDANGDTTSAAVKLATVTSYDAGAPVTASYSQVGYVDVAAPENIAAKLSLKDSSSRSTFLVGDETVGHTVAKQVPASDVTFGAISAVTAASTPAVSSGVFAAYDVSIVGGAGGSNIPTVGSLYTITSTILNGASAFGSTTVTYRNVASTLGLTGSIAFINATTKAVVSSIARPTSGTIAATTHAVVVKDSTGAVVVGVTPVATATAGTVSAAIGATDVNGTNNAIAYSAAATAGTATVSIALSTGSSSLTTSFTVVTTAYGATAATNATVKSVVAVNGSGVLMTSTAPDTSAWSSAINVTGFTVTLSGLEASKAAVVQLTTSGATSPTVNGTAVSTDIFPVASATGEISLALAVTGAANGNTLTVTVDPEGNGSAVTVLVITYATATNTITTDPKTGTLNMSTPSATKAITAAGTDQFKNPITGGSFKLTNTVVPAGATAAPAVTVNQSATGTATLNAVLGATLGTYTFTVELISVNAVVLATSTINYSVTTTGIAGSLTLTDTDTGTGTLTTDDKGTRAIVVNRTANVSLGAAVTNTATAITVTTATPTGLAFTATATNGIRLFTTAGFDSATITPGLSTVTGTAGSSANLWAVPTKTGAGTITVVSGGLTKVYTLTGTLNATATTVESAIVTLTPTATAGQYTVKAADAFGNGVVNDVTVSLVGPGTFSNGFKNLTVTTGADGTNTFNVVSDGSAATTITATLNSASGVVGRYVAIDATQATAMGVVLPGTLGASTPTATATLAGKGGDSSSTSLAALTTLINSLIAKINALNKLVIKIQKKVRA